MEEQSTSATPRLDRHDDRPVSELIKDLGEQTSTLVRQELELARAELTQKGRAAGMGASLFGGAGLFGVFAFAALTTCLIALLATALDHVWLAALIVAAVYGAIAGVLALTGKGKVEQATPPVPERTQASVKADIESTKAHARAGRH
jgi:MFS family permease